jgi:hypothetical protein
MSIINRRRGPETITIPHAQLEDARTAIIGEIESDAAWLLDQQREVLSEDLEAVPEDRAAALGVLRSDVRVLDQLLEASGDVVITAERRTAGELLHAMARVLIERLHEEVNHGSLDMGLVLDSAERLRWIGGEARRLELADDPAASAEQREAVA